MVSLAVPVPGRCWEQESQLQCCPESLTPLGFEQWVLAQTSPSKQCWGTVWETVRPENIPRWWLWTRLPCFGKERGWSAARWMQNQAMYFLPSWPTVPVVQGFPESELESSWEFDCSQLLYILWICPNMCEIHGKLLHPSHPLASSSTAHFSVINAILKCKW